MADKIVGDLISRKALLSALPRFEKDRVGYPLNGGIAYAKIQINAAPSVDAVEVLHGRWMKRGNETKCSVCKFIYYSNHDDFNYCPNCGAKMDGDRHENP